MYSAVVPLLASKSTVRLANTSLRPSGDSEDEKDRIHRPGTLVSAGLITGEALMGIAIAVPIVVSGRADVLRLPEAWHFSQIFGLGVLVVVGWLLYRSGAKSGRVLGDVEPGPL